MTENYSNLAEIHGEHQELLRLSSVIAATRSALLSCMHVRPYSTVKGAHLHRSSSGIHLHSLCMPMLIIAIHGGSHRGLNLRALSVQAVPCLCSQQP